MTEEILHLMGEKRNTKVKDNKQYETIYHQIRKKIRIEREYFNEQKCENIVDLQEKNDNFNVHKKETKLTDTNVNSLAHYGCV